MKTNEGAAALAGLLEDDSVVVRLARRFRNVGHELYLVGGPVRDAILGRPFIDLDLTTDAKPEETHELVKPLASAVWLQGIEFGTVGAEIEGVRMEMTTFRTERYEPDSRH